MLKEEGEVSGRVPTATEADLSKHSVLTLLGILTFTSKDVGVPAS